MDYEITAKDKQDMLVDGGKEVSIEVTVGELCETKVLGKITRFDGNGMEVIAGGPRIPCTGFWIYSFEREKEVLGGFPRKLTDEESRIILESPATRYAYKRNGQDSNYRLEVVSGLNKGFTLEATISNDLNHPV